MEFENKSQRLLRSTPSFFYLPSERHIECSNNTEGRKQRTMERKEDERQSKRQCLASPGDKKLKAAEDQSTRSSNEIHETDQLDLPVIEADSLLILADGADSPIVSHVMWFLSFEGGCSM